MSERKKISAFLICCNEERNIERCLNSLQWCDEVIAVDSGSTDTTLEICKRHKVSIYHRDWTGFVDQKRYGLELCSHEWVLNIDADEEVSEALRDEICQLLSRESEPEVQGYYINRVVYFLNRWWRKGGWYPEYRLRLLKKAHTRWGGEDPHEKAIVDGLTRKLHGELFHYTYRDFQHQILSLNSHSSAAAQSLYKRGKKASLHHFILNPPVRFLRFYLLKKGYREGFAGFAVGILEAYYVFLKYIKLWELNRQRDQQETGQG